MGAIKISGDGSVEGTTVTLEHGDTSIALPCVRFELRRDGDDVRATIVLDVLARDACERIPKLDVSIYTGPNALDVGTTQHDWKGPLSPDDLARVRAELRGNG